MQSSLVLAQGLRVCDIQDAEQSAPSAAVSNAVLGEKDGGLGTKAAQWSEMEALRKDPFKNYASNEL